MPLRRIVAFAGALLGFAGAIACMIAMAAALWAGGRLDRANDRTFAAVQTSLGAARELVVRSRDRTHEAAAAADDLAGVVRRWARREISSELAARIDHGAGRVARRLELAQVWAESSAASVRNLAQTIDVIRRVSGTRGKDDDDVPTQLAAAADRIDDLSARLRQAIANVEDLGQQAAAWAATTSTTDRPPDNDDERIPRLTRLAAAVDAALRQIEARLDEAANGLAERQSGAERLRVRVRYHIALATSGAILLLAWIAAGQAALCAFGVKHMRGLPAPIRPTASSA